MSFLRTVDEIQYPESDGKPMAETELHQDWMIRLRDIVRLRYHGQRVYVAGNLLVYYQQGDPRRSVAPDLFVVLDCDPGRRRTFKIWEEGKTPDMVIEVTSESTRREDEVTKPQVYARMGVPEYFLYDPTSDYLNPPLQGFRLGRGKYKRIQPDTSGALACERLGLLLRLEESQLQLYDGSTGRPLPTAVEAAEAGRMAAETARAAAEQRAAELEAELQRLRSQMPDRSAEA